jgi:hypothetical protein
MTVMESARDDDGSGVIFLISKEILCDVVA